MLSNVRFKNKYWKERHFQCNNVYYFLICWFQLCTVTWKKSICKINFDGFGSHLLMSDCFIRQVLCDQRVQFFHQNERYSEREWSWTVQTASNIFKMIYTVLMLVLMTDSLKMMGENVDGDIYSHSSWAREYCSALTQSIHSTHQKILF